MKKYCFMLFYFCLVFSVSIPVRARTMHYPQKTIDRIKYENSSLRHNIFQSMEYSGMEEEKPQLPEVKKQVPTPRKVNYDAIDYSKSAAEAWEESPHPAIPYSESRLLIFGSGNNSAEMREALLVNPLLLVSRDNRKHLENMYNVSGLSPREWSDLAMKHVASRWYANQYKLSDAVVFNNFDELTQEIFGEKLTSKEVYLTLRENMIEREETTKQEHRKNSLIFVLGCSGIILAIIVLLYGLSKCHVSKIKLSDLQKIMLGLAVVSSGLMIAACIGRFSSGYYIFLRIVVCAAFCGLFFEKKLFVLCKFSALLFAILYNPIIQIHLNGRSTWRWFNIVSIITLMVAWGIIFFKSMGKKENSSEKMG